MARLETLRVESEKAREESEAKARLKTAQHKCDIAASLVELLQCRARRVSAPTDPAGLTDLEASFFCEARQAQYSEVQTLLAAAEARLAARLAAAEARFKERAAEMARLETLRVESERNHVWGRVVNEELHRVVVSQGSSGSGGKISQETSIAFRKAYSVRRNADLRCAVCGYRRGDGRSQKIVSRAHILAEEACVGTEIPYSERNFIPLCGHDGAPGTCHHAFDRNLMAFIHNPRLGSWTCHTIDANRQPQRKQVVFPNMPKRRAMHARAAIAEPFLRYSAADRSDMAKVTDESGGESRRGGPDPGTDDGDGDPSSGRDTRPRGSRTRGGGSTSGGGDAAGRGVGGGATQHRGGGGTATKEAACDGRVKLCRTQLAGVPFDPPLVEDWTELDLSDVAVVLAEPIGELDGVVATIKAARPDPSVEEMSLGPKFLPTLPLVHQPSFRSTPALLAAAPSDDASTPARLEQGERQLQTREGEQPHEFPLRENECAVLSRTVPHIVAVHEEMGASYLQTLDRKQGADAEITSSAARKSLARALTQQEIFALQQLTSQRQPISWVRRRALGLCSRFSAAVRPELYAFIVEQLLAECGATPV